MIPKRSSLAVLAGFGLICFLRLPVPCFAQENPSEPLPQPADCPPLKGFPQLAASVVVSCETQNSMKVTMPLSPDADGSPRQKEASGSYEYREYRIPRTYQQEGAFAALTNLAPMAGFIVKYAEKPSTITARNGDTWVLINVSDDFYNISVVVEAAQPWTPVANAEQISQQMDAHGRVEIDGIQFKPNDQAIQEAQSLILFEVLKYLQQNPNLVVVIESHKVSSRGTAQEDMEITRQRANAMVEWLVAHGIERTRLTPKPFGRTKALSENDTPLEIERNERIVIAKTTS
jgi:outer membrane protein OmpA-like peptidoglycan-associated protein